MFSFRYWAYDDYRNEANFDVSWNTIYCNLGQFTLIIGKYVIKSARLENNNEVALSSLMKWALCTFTIYYYLNKRYRNIAEPKSPEFV
jgi:hypothetical protein